MSDEAKKRLYRKRIDPDYEAYQQKVGEHIRVLRIDANEDQDEFARLANIHRSHVSSLENARTDPTLSTLFKVAKALGMSVSELLEVE